MEKIYALIKPLLMIYVFTLPFTHITSVRETAFVSLFTFFVIKLFHKGSSIDFRDRTVQAFCLLAGVAIITSILGPYPYESLNFIRKNILYQAVVFFVILNEYKGFDELKPLLYTLIASYALLTVLVLTFNSPTVLLHWIEHLDKKFASGYALHGTFYIPLLAGLLYTSLKDRRLKWGLLFILIVELTLCILDNHRSQIAAISLALVAVTLLARRWKILFAGLLVTIVLGAALFAVEPGMFTRYKTLLQPRTYLSDEYGGWNGRFFIWSGVADMIKERPLTGYGYGWKKMATVAREGGFLERWNETKPKTYAFFATRYYGSTTSHNLILQILFEGGVAGLAAFLIFWTTVCMKVLPLPPLPRQGIDRGAAFLRYGATGILISYALVNVAWSLWEEVAGVLMMLFAALCVVLYKEIKDPHFLLEKRKRDKENQRGN
ncbi:MAG: O-antigen ligase family protein [Thermodesulfobacteriota bacterium]